MASPAQVVANRRNARRSTGPKTAEGRAVVSRNALRHGMTAEQVILDETPEDFAEFLAGFRAALAPSDAIEDQLVERLVLCAWRLRRACRSEAGLLNNTVLEDGWEKPFTEIGTAFARACDDIAILSRYEAAIERSYQRASVTLERLQARRRGEPVPVPIVVAVEGGGDPAAPAIR